MSRIPRAVRLPGTDKRSTRTLRERCANARRGGNLSEGISGGRQLDAAAVFDEHRGLLVSVAYRILGSVTDAEDAVQEAYLRWSGVEHSEIKDPRAFLVRITTRLAIDRLRRARTRRESYVGPWLPEPVLTGQ